MVDDAARIGRVSQRKGAEGERNFARLLSQALGVQARREGYRQRGGGSVAPDVDWDGAPFWCECKVGAAPNVRKALWQAQQASDGRIPVVMVLDNGAESPFVVMPFDGWVRLAAQFDPGCGELVELIERRPEAWRVLVRRLGGDEVVLPLDWLGALAATPAEKATIFVSARREQ